jgi:hypothetical protein
MKNFKNYYAKVDGMANSKLAKPKKEAGKGLLSKQSTSEELSKTDSKDVFGKVSDYIAAIRKQKEELMNGRS